MRVKFKTLQSVVLYDYRYIFAYLIVGVFALYFLAWRLGSLPNGLSSQELQMAASSSALADLMRFPLYPLHGILQWLSLHIFGVSAISIRLPSIMIAAATVVILYNLLKKWFGRVTSLLTAAFLLSADWFLFIARSGTGAIEFSFWFSLLLLSMMKLIENKPKWLIGYGISSALLLFSPFGIYAVLTSTVCLWSCVMFRKRASEAPLSVKVVAATALALALSIIVALGIKEPLFIKSLLGISELPTPFLFMKNMVLNASGVAMIWPDNNPLLGPTGIFLIRFVEFIFMLFGVIMLWVTRVNRLNLVVLASAGVLALASGLSSDTRGGSLLIVPAVIFFTCGLRHFIHRWQRTFPKNPYARVALYIPLTIMLLSATVLHYQSYFVLWPRQTDTNKVYLQDYRLLKNELSKSGTCWVYDAPSYYETLIKTEEPVCETSFATSTALVEPPAGVRAITKTPSQAPITRNATSPRALTSGTQQSNVRWLVYQL